MGLPQGFKKNVKFIKDKVGPDRRQEILDDIANQGTFLPRGVMYEDMDQTFVDFITDDLKIVIDGEEVPVIFLTIQRWAEFSKTWQFSDKFENINLPFITIVRKPDIQVGQNQAGMWNIPGRRTYTYMKVPTFEGGRKGVDVYKIPQPVAVDVNYEVRLFCNRMRDLNKLNIKVQKEFKSRQSYLRVNGHPMPVYLENVGDESPIDDFESRRFYVQLFEMRLEGYILDEDDFEVVPAINRAMMVEEVTEEVSAPRVKVKAAVDESMVNYSFVFKAGSDDTVTITPDFDINFTDILFISNVTGVTIQVNGSIVTTPFVVTAGEEINLTVAGSELVTRKFNLIGNLL
jgi:hypothetical protein